MYTTRDTVAHHFLNRARSAEMRIAWKQSQLDGLRDIATNVTPTLSDMPRSSSPNPQRMETLMCKIVDMEADIARDADALADIRVEIALLICKVPDATQQQILRERYLNYKAWRSIMDMTGYSKTSIFRHHDAAIAYLNTIIAADNDLVKVGT